MSKWRLATYNIRKGLGASGRDDTTHLLAKALAEHALDFVLCQEVFHDHSGDKPQSQLLGTALDLVSHYQPNKHRKVGHHGNATFTDEPAQEVENYDVSTNRFERRGVLFVRVALDDEPLHILNVHLGLNHFQRLAQMRQIADIMAARCPPNEAVILAGDFNDWAKRLDPLITRELGLTNAFADKEPALVRTWPAQRPVFALDRVYTRHLVLHHSERLHGGHWQSLSDHLPLVVEIARR
jgi:endonuclease/exonuclease/phosphatase family metal-dependent hydrolase